MIYLLAYLSFQQIRDYQAARSADMNLICSAHKLQSNSLDSRLPEWDGIFVGVHKAVAVVVNGGTVVVAAVVWYLLRMAR